MTIDSIYGTERQKTQPTSNNVSSEEVTQMHMAQYYKRLFPFREYYNWLNYSSSAGATKNVKNREFSFTIQEDIYLRYQSFSSEDELRKEIILKCPNKIDIGAIYNIPPKLAKTVQSGVLKPLEKELVFDIDMTDYDDIRTCCSGGDICLKCWGWMSAAMKILNTALVEDFGFRNNIFIYSGRRGVHCWVCDERARGLDNAGRKAVVGYLSVIKGGAEQSKKVSLGTGEKHPHIQRSLAIAKKYFKKIILESQDLLKYRSGWKKILEMQPSSELAEKLGAKWAHENEKLGVGESSKQNTDKKAEVETKQRFDKKSRSDHDMQVDGSEDDDEDGDEGEDEDEDENKDVHKNSNSGSGSGSDSEYDYEFSFKGNTVSTKRWAEFTRELDAESKKKSKEIKMYPSSIISEIILEYVYPRLDENVSTHLNHLLKSPFCIHPKTGKVCVPIAHHEFDRFNPLNVPTVFQLLDEINAYDSAKKQSAAKAGISISGESSQAENGGENAANATSDKTNLATKIPESDIEKTSLKKYVNLFDILVKKISTTDPSVRDNLAF